MLFFTASLAAFVCAGPVPQVEVRVRQTPGGPRLFVDGKRHLAQSVKMLGGGTLPLRIGVEWRKFEIPLTMTEDKPHGMFVLRFEKKISYGKCPPPGWVRLRGFTVVDDDDRSVFPEGSFSSAEMFKKCWWTPKDTGHIGSTELEPEGVLRVDLHGPDPSVKGWSLTTRNSDFYLATRPKAFPVRRGCRYRLRFEARGDKDQDMFPGAYQQPGFVPIPVPPDTFDGTIRMAKDVGVDIVFAGSGMLWPRGGKVSFAKIERTFDKVIAANPGALVVVRVGVRPPSWMFDEHPDWRTKYFGDGKTQDDDSVSCLPWRDIALRNVDALVRHLMRKYPRNFAGVHISAHRAGEWLYEDMLRGRLGGADVHTEAAWRRYLAALGEPGAESALVPTDTERRATPDGEMLPDPVADKRICDFNRFYSREMADRIAELAEVVRKASDGKKIVMFFYGYSFEVAARGAESGHFALKYLLDKAAGNIDILAGPFSYHDRTPPGDTRPVMAPADTLAKYGVMWWNEDDTRTYLERNADALHEQKGRVATKEETLRTLERNVRQCAERNHGFWWVDLHSHGWYYDPDLWALMDKVRPYAMERLASDEPFSPRVAAIVSEESMIYRRLAASWTCTMAVSYVRREFERAGVAIGQYLFEDVVDRDIPARFRFYLNPWYLAKADRVKLSRQRAARPDLVRVWMYAPGYLDETGKSVGRIEDAVGFKARKVASKKFPKATPLFAVEPAQGDEVWDRYEDGSPSIVCRRLPGGGAEIFHAAPVMDGKTLQKILSL